MTLTSQIQTEMQTVTQVDTESMDEQQLQDYIKDIHKGLTAINQLPMTSRFNHLLKERQSVKNAEARISELLEEGGNLKQELTLTQEKVVTLETRVLECGHGDLAEKVRSLEEQLVARVSEQMDTDMIQELEDAQTQLEIERALLKEYREQVTQVLKLTEGRTGGG